MVRYARSGGIEEGESDQKQDFERLQSWSRRENAVRMRPRFVTLSTGYLKDRQDMPLSERDAALMIIARRGRPLLLVLFGGLGPAAGHPAAATIHSATAALSG